eukprot:m.173664 g.173664  ORF g.173664 m.173664 type:complete len:648 (-) comp31737_c0_seq3:375-2318(-)
MSKQKEQVDSPLQTFRSKWLSELKQPSLPKPVNTLASVSSAVQTNVQNHNNSTHMINTNPDPRNVHILPQRHQSIFHENSTDNEPKSLLVIPPLSAAETYAPETRNSKRQKVSEFEEDDDGDVDYLALLIQDIDDICEVPLFDTTIPREVATKILSFCDFRTLCSCGQTSKTWKILADDEVLWHRLTMQHKESMYMDLSRKRSNMTWRLYFSRETVREQEIQLRWKEMKAVTTMLDVSTAASSRTTSTCEFGSVVCGFLNNTVAEWGMLDSSERPRQVYDFNDHADDNHGMTSGIQSIATSAALIAGATYEGRLAVWLRGASSPVFTTTRHMPLHALPQAQAHNLRKYPNNPMVLLETQPTLVWANASSIACYSADQTTSWEQCWTQDYNPDETNERGHITTLRAIGNTAVVSLSTESVDVWSTISGVKTASLQSNFDTQYRCSALALGGDSICYGLTDSVHSSLKVFDSHTAALKSVFDTPASVMSMAYDGHLITAATKNQIFTYDLRSEKLEHHMRAHMSLNTVDVNDWTIVGGGYATHEFGRGMSKVWDRRMGKQLWFINLMKPVQQVVVNHDALYNSSVLSSTGVHVDRGDSHFSNVMNFAAPDSALADATCPFSSSFDNVQGYNDDLVMPYDNVNNYALGGM